MKKYTIAVLMLVSASVVMTACNDAWSFTSKETVPPAAPPGKIIGYVGLHDEHGGGILDTGVTVTLGSTEPVKTASTDMHGRFQFDSIAPGSYDITYEKPGYGTYKTYGFVLAGGNTPASLGKINLVKVASAIVDSLTVDTSSLDHIMFSAWIHPTAGDSACNAARFFIGMDDPNVSYSNYSFADSDYGTVSYNPANHTVQYCLPLSQVNGYVIKSLPLYAVAYGAPADNSAYFDITAGITVWPALNTAKSNTVTFQVH